MTNLTKYFSFLPELNSFVLVNQCALFLFILLQTVEIAVALFQVDIEQMTLTLLRRVIPRLLADLSNIDRLSNPRGKALAKLVVWCIAATLTSQNSFRGKTNLFFQ